MTRRYTTKERIEAVEVVDARVLDESRESRCRMVEDGAEVVRDEDALEEGDQESLSR
jgi:hypothetical protein